jgi:hypothetical protein
MQTNPGSFSFMTPPLFRLVQFPDLCYKKASFSLILVIVTILDMPSSYDTNPGV